MSHLPVWLGKFRYAPSQRAHFAIWIPNAEHAEVDPNDRPFECKGTLINLVGLPMSGYCHEFKRNACCNDAAGFRKAGSNWFR